MMTVTVVYRTTGRMLMTRRLLLLVVVTLEEPLPQGLVWQDMRSASAAGIHRGTGRINTLRLITIKNVWKSRHDWEQGVLECSEQLLFSCLWSKVTSGSHVCQMSIVKCQMSTSEQLLFSCLWSKVMVYRWKWQWHHPHPCPWYFKKVHRAGSRLKIGREGLL